MILVCSYPRFVFPLNHTGPSDKALDVSMPMDNQLNTDSPATWFDISDVHSSGFGTLKFQTRNGKRLSAYIYRATNFVPMDGPIWFVMHGAKRNAKRYLKAAAPVAERYHTLVIAIEFPKRDYPRGSDYTLGVLSHGKIDETAYKEGRWRKQEAYLYTEIERLFESVRKSLGGLQSGYYMFGHSAGAQFTHRHITFMPESHVLGAVAANAGWYTLPVLKNDSQFTVPYGLYGSPETNLEAILAAPLTLLLGTHDTATPVTDPLLRGTPQAMAQGATRLTRGRNYFKTGKNSADLMGTPLGWQLIFAPGAEHQVVQVIASAGFILFSRNESPCRSSLASESRSLVFNEVLAITPHGHQGDMNLDGVQNTSSDEFVEFVNTGTTPICLSGWSLNDANGQQHLFPIGRALRPGKAVVVFGGGVPAGRFGDADIQWATSRKGLNLSNSGDVITLRDRNGTMVKQISWGDCASKRCANEHIKGGLGFSGSYVRWPESVGTWHLHREVAGSDFSPGLRADGLVW